MATINWQSDTSTTIQVWLSDLDTAYSYSDRYAVYTLSGNDGTFKTGTSATEASGISTGFYYTFTGLTASTSYSITCIVYGEHITNGYTSIGSGVTATTTTTTVPEINVNKWDWDSSNGNATASETTLAYDAVRNQGYLRNFSYKVWNDMVDKVVEILNAYHDAYGSGWRWNTYYASLNDTYMSDSDKEMTAIRFNSLKYNIGVHRSTGINDVNKDDIIYGNYFITLTNVMNDYANWVE